VIVGLGSWAGRQDWPLPWISTAPSVKIYGVVFAPTFVATVELSWQRVTAKLEAVVRLWAVRRLPTLAMLRSALEVYAFSLLWYLAQILPLLPTFHCRIRSAAGNFHWRDRLERLPWDELHAPPA
jgi:hypothetical protein